MTRTAPTAPAADLRLLAALALSLGIAALAVPRHARADEKADVPKLVKDLKDPDAFVRLRAAKALGQLGAAAKDAVPALEEATRDEDEDVKLVAERALAAVREAAGADGLAEQQKALRPLLLQFRSKKLSERVAAAEELGKLGEKARPAVGYLIEHGLLSPVPALREASAAAIERIDPLLHEQLILLLVDTSTDRQRLAVEGLAGMGKRAEPALVGLKYYYARTGYVPALEAIIRIDPADAVVVREVLASASTPDTAARKPLSRYRAVQLLRSVELDNKRRVAALVSALGDRSSFCRALAADELGRLGKDAEAALPVLTRLKLDGVAEVRQAAERAIALIESE